MFKKKIMIFFILTLILFIGAQTNQEDVIYLSVPNHETRKFEMVAVPKPEVLNEKSVRAVPDFVVDTLIRSKKPSLESMSFTILGDGFTATQQDAFIMSAKSVADSVTKRYPFSIFDNINVYAIRVISNVSGAGRLPNEIIDNYFGSVFNVGGTERLLWYANPSAGSQKVRDLINHYTPNANLTMILVNDLRYGGSGGEVAFSSLGDLYQQVMIHEVGHALGLSDEYWHTQVAESPNRTANNNSSTIRWRHWLNLENIGIFQFSGQNWFKPTNNKCTMEWIEYEFCKVCATQLTRNLAQKSSEEFYGWGTVAAQTSLTTKDIIQSTVRVLPYAYVGNEQLHTLTIPASATYIGEYAFLRCYDLTKITNNATIPQIIDNKTFYGVNRENVTLHIPVGTKAAYLAAGWTDFNIIEDIDPDEEINCDGVSDFKEVEMGTAGAIKAVYEGDLYMSKVDNAGWINIDCDGEKNFEDIDMFDVMVPGGYLKVVYDGKLWENKDFGTNYTTFDENQWTLLGECGSKRDDVFKPEQWVLIGSCDNDTTIIDTTISIFNTKTTDNRFGIMFENNIVSNEAKINVVLPNNEKAIETKIVIYDMTGNIVFVGAVAHDRPLIWDLKNQNGRIIANGTYLVIAEVKSANGKTYHYSAKLGVRK